MRIVLFGANNPESARIVHELMNDDEDIESIEFLDNDKTLTDVCGLPILGGWDRFPDIAKERYWFVNIVTGSTKKRWEVTRKLIYFGCKFTNFIYPGVNRFMVNLGMGIYIQEGVLLQAGIKIGDHVAIHTGAIVAHECTIGAHSFIAHGACISGKVEIGEGVFVGANATILPRIKIGKWSTIGAGAVVTKDVAEYSVVVGNPARVIR